MLPFLFINWSVAPELYVIKIFDFELPITWYGIFFAFGFLIGQQIMYFIFRRDGKTIKDVDSLTVYMIAGTIIGARLGHYLFYEWQLLFAEPLTWIIELIIPPFTGLASHGATIAIPIALYLYARTKTDQSFLYVTDRVVIPVAFGGALIRLGNLFNSEIYGLPTDLPWGFRFLRETNPDLLPIVPRHPTQLYEALFCLFLLALTFYLWSRRRHILPTGFITGIFLILLFSFRIAVEFLKNNQSDFENGLALNMGQLLSIPVVLAGFVVLFYSFSQHKIKKNAVI